MTGARVEATHTPRRLSATPWFLAIWMVCGASAILAFFVDALWHWMLIPTTAAGVLVGVDVARWAMREIDTMHPRALVGLFGFHMVYVVPITHLALDDVWPLFVPPATDWQGSLGTLALINTAGLLIYRFLVGRPPRRDARPPRTWELDRRRFKTAATFAVLVGFGAFVYNVLSYGGPAGYLAVLSDVEQRGAALAGTGWILLVAESWPLVLFVAFVVLRRETLSKRPVQIALLLAFFIVAQFLVGGLRGSRANTVWPVLIGLGVVHLAVRPVRRRALAIGAIALLSFSWAYGVYKAYGSEAFSVVAQSGLSQTASDSNRSAERTLLEDFGRAGIQAVVVDRAEAGRTPLALGATYASAGLFLLPEGVLPAQPRGKVEVGTDFLYGPGSYFPGSGSSRIYGLVGEGIMNFGPWLAALMFAPFALAVRAAARRYEAGTLVSAVQGPILAVACLLLLGSDLDNAIFFLVKHGAPLLAILWVSRVRQQGGGSRLARAAGARPRTVVRPSLR